MLPSKDPQQDIEVAFDRCLGALDDFMYAYELETHAELALITERRLPRLIPALITNLTGPITEELPPKFLGTRQRILTPAGYKDLDEVRMRRIAENINFVRKGHPFNGYLTQKGQTRHLLYDEGDKANTTAVDEFISS